MVRRTLRKPFVTGSLFLAMATVVLVVSGPPAGLGFGMIATAWYINDVLQWRRSRGG
jgi:hypothetical protein